MDPNFIQPISVDQLGGSSFLLRFLVDDSLLFHEDYVPAPDDLLLG